MLSRTIISAAALPQFAAAFDLAKELAQTVPELSYESWDLHSLLIPDIRKKPKLRATQRPTPLILAHHRKLA